MRRWPAPVVAEPVTGTVTVPGSKSASARALVLAALSDGPSRLSGVLDSRDTTLMQAGLTTLGTAFHGTRDGHLTVEPPQDLQGGGVIDVGLAGTVLRFLPAIAVMAPQPTSFVGDTAAQKRPISPLLEALAAAGAEVSSPQRLPFTIAGGLDFSGGELNVDASASSQFISGLLLAAGRYRDGARIHHTGAAVPSRPHIEMTCALLARHGVAVSTPDETTWVVEPQQIRAHDDIVEPDLTNAATLLAAALVTEGELTTAWPDDSVQPADGLASVLAAFGGELRYHDGAGGRELTVIGHGVRGTEIDLHAVSEFTPVAAALAAVADGPTRISGVAHIRGHETDRLAALTTELRAIGVEITELDDGLIIQPRPRRGGVFSTYGDHRMAHAGALVGLVTPGIELDDVSCTTKTLPDFPGLWQRLVGGTR